MRKSLVHAKYPFLKFDVIFSLAETQGTQGKDMKTISRVGRALTLFTNQSTKGW